MSSEYIVIDTQEAMDRFLWLVDGFHDALLREVGIVSQGYVDTGDMYGDVAPSDMRLIIHSQFEETPYIEIIFRELKEFKWIDGYDLEPAKGSVANDLVTLFFSSNSKNFLVSGKQMEYRILGRDCLGKQPRTVEQIQSE
ncbi:MAG: hypothetical protein ABFD46_05220 [Armatimonadota bacterium]